MQNFKKVTNSKSFLLITLLAIYLTAWLNQSYFLLNWDVSWCIHAASQLLKGGNYIKDFFDVNLPLTLYLYAPPILFSKWFSITLPIACQIYLFLLITLSLYLCYALNDKAFSDNKPAGHFFIISYAFILLILPQFNFGEREHLLLIFTMPYVLLVTCRLSDKSIQPALALLIGIFAALGFVIKPYYLISVALIELYYCYHKRSLLGWCRTEVLSIGIIALSSVALMIWAYPNYLYVVTPLLIKYFYTGYSSDPLIVYLYTPSVLFCTAALVFYLLQKKIIPSYPYQTITNLLAMMLVGTLFCYLLQKTAWPYHIMPAVSFASLIFLLLFAYCVERLPKNKYGCTLAALLGVAVFAYPLLFINDSYNRGASFYHDDQPLISFMQQNTANKKVYFLSTNIYDSLPAIDYTNTTLSERTAHLLLLPGILLKQKELTHNPFAFDEHNLFTNMIIDDLIQNKPDFVFVDVKDHKNFLMDFKFDYIPYFSQDARFRSAWKNYRYVTTIEQRQAADVSYDDELISVASLNQLALAKMKLFSIVLTGAGSNRNVYLVVYNGLFKIRGETITGHIKLTASEQQFLQQNDLSLHKNTVMLNQIRQKAIMSLTDLFPVYKLDVYQHI